jgi:hypothetical protein
MGSRYGKEQHSVVQNRLFKRLLKITMTRSYLTMGIFHMTTTFHHIRDLRTLDYLEFHRTLEIMAVASTLVEFIQTHHPHLHIQGEAFYHQHHLQDLQLHLVDLRRHLHRHTQEAVICRQPILMLQLHQVLLMVRVPTPEESHRQAVKSAKNRKQSSAT